MRLSLDLGLGSIATLGAGGRYDPAASALFARQSVPLASPYKAIVSDHFKALRSFGLLDLFDTYYGPADNELDFRLNWMGDQYNLTPIGSSFTFTPWVGCKGDGSTSKYTTGFNPTTAVSPKFTQNSAHISFVSNTAGQSNNQEMGSTNSTIGCRTSIDTFSGRINSSTTTAPASANGAGEFTASRTGSGGTDGGYYKDGALLSSTINATTAPDNNEIHFLGRSGTASFSVREGVFGSIGSGLTAQNIADLHAARLDMMEALENEDPANNFLVIL